MVPAGSSSSGGTLVSVAGAATGGICGTAFDGVVAAGNPGAGTSGLAGWTIALVTGAVGTALERTVGTEAGALVGAPGSVTSTVTLVLPSNALCNASCRRASRLVSAAVPGGSAKPAGALVWADKFRQATKRIKGGVFRLCG